MANMGRPTLYSRVLAIGTHLMAVSVLAAVIGAVMRAM